MSRSEADLNVEIYVLITSKRGAPERDQRYSIRQESPGNSARRLSGDFPALTGSLRGAGLQHSSGLSFLPVETTWAPLSSSFCLTSLQPPTGMSVCGGGGGVCAHTHVCVCEWGKPQLTCDREQPQVWLPIFHFVRVSCSPTYTKLPGP